MSVKSLMSSIHSTEAQLIVLAPKATVVPGTFRYVNRNEALHRSLLAELQRFRGSVYLNDGAITARELTQDRRHAPVVDEKSWHVLSLDRQGKVCGCLRFLEETGAEFDELCVRQSAVAHCPTWGQKFRRAIEFQMSRAQADRLRFGEVGGWAISVTRRWTVEALRVILATYGLLQLLGGCIGVATATLRHESARILRRIGLWPMAVEGVALPPYYDDRYRCQMEVLQFDSRLPNSKYIDWIMELGSYLSTTPVICPERAPQPLFRPLSQHGAIGAFA
jgi:hypothetical protein